VSIALAARRADRIATALTAARARSSGPILIAFLTLYCDGETCSAREVVVLVKEHDAPIVAELCCPACRRPLTLHYVETREERPVAEEAEARSNVVAQLYTRRHPGEGIPLAAFLGASLEDLIARVLADEGRA
jgi:uncharacterized protein YbaR (Trm112 family)